MEIINWNSSGVYEVDEPKLLGKDVKSQNRLTKRKKIKKKINELELFSELWWKNVWDFSESTVVFNDQICD